MEDGEAKPHNITFLLKTNYDDIGKPKLEECDNPILLEFDSKQKHTSFDMGSSLKLEKNIIRVKVKFDV